MRTASRFGPPLALMGAIFFFSSQPDLGTGLGTWDLVLRKLAHMAEYALLWVLLHRAFEYRHRLAAVAFALAYAASDEFHQSFIEGRHGTPVDVLIDAVGIAIAVGLWQRRKARKG